MSLAVSGESMCTWRYDLAKRDYEVGTPMQPYATPFISFFHHGNHLSRNNIQPYLTLPFDLALLDQFC